MTQPDQVLIARLTSDVATMSSYLGRVSADLRELERRIVRPAEAPSASPPIPPSTPPSAAPQTTPPRAPVGPAPEVAYPSEPSRPDGWIGKALAVAGVAVTLVGVVLLLVLAAQAGLLSPGIRVASGALLAGALVTVAARLRGRPGGRVGAIALSATGIATAYIDAVAVTTIYRWVPGGVGLLLTAVVAGAGLTLARRWDSEPLALLVLVPLLVLGPVVVGSVSLLLVGYMIVLSAAALPIALGKDWIGMLAARIAVATVPLLLGLSAIGPQFGRSAWVAGACGIAALLALSSAVILLPHTGRPTAVALLSAAGTLPVLYSSVAVDRATSAVMSAVLAGVLLALAVFGDRVAADPAGRARGTWAAASAVSGLVAITVGFDAPVAGPLLLGTSLVVAIAGRRDAVARWSALGFGVIGGSYYLVAAPPTNVLSATVVSGPTGAVTLLSSLLVIASAVATTWSWVRPAHGRRELGGAPWVASAALTTYAITMFTVTAGVLIGGPESGFFAGHVAATVCWVALAAVILRYAAGLPRAHRPLPMGAGVAVVAAAMAKLFLFDLGTLAGIFRVAVFIVVGLTLLGMGSGYARMLSHQDDEQAGEPA